MKYFRKRSGQLVDWEPAKIETAIGKAFSATGYEKPDAYVMNKIMLNIMADVTAKATGDTADIEDVQNAVEKVLSESGYYPVARAYITYRNKRNTARDIRQNLVSVTDLVKGYLDRLDWRVKENSTVSYSIGGFILSNSGAVTANYWLNEIYDEEIANAHKQCFIHLHDLSMLSGYCAGWNLKQLIQRGIEGPLGKISSGPASHLSTLCNQMVNFLGIMQNEWAGAQAFSSFDTYLAPFVKADNLTYKEVKQCIQSFVFGVNTPSRWGTQAPFTNITLDWNCPVDIAPLPAIVGGKEMDYTYGDCQKEMDIVNKAFLEIMNEGDWKGRGFQYPIPTYSITKNFDWSDTENNRLLFEMTAKYGTPYFSNYVNSDMDPSDIRSMCCRLRLDLRELRRKNGGFFGAGESTGSIGVVTLNLPKIAYVSRTEEEFWKNLDHYMDVAARSLRTKREIITELLNINFYPYTKTYLPEGLGNHFSTIGLVGGNEMCLNASWLRKDLTHKESQDFCERMLNHMRGRLSDYQEKYAPDLYNLEATPAESTAYRFAKHDKAEYPDIITANETSDAPYYTNSTNLPVGYTDDVFDALDIQDRLQPLYTSGTVFHTFLGEKLPTWQSAAKLVRSITDNYKLPYISISPTYSICPEHGYISGEHFSCPVCGKDSEVYSRITGYYRPVQNWNEGKGVHGEFGDRKTYVVSGTEGRHKHPDTKPAENGNDTVQEKEPAGRVINPDVPTIFKTSTCPNCKLACAKLDAAKIAYDVVNCTEDPETAARYKVTQAPTLLIGDKRYGGAGAIINWIREQPFTEHCSK